VIVVSGPDKMVYGEANTVVGTDDGMLDHETTTRLGWEETVTTYYDGTDETSEAGTTYGE
jgi:hypothetical protein